MGPLTEKTKTGSLTEDEQARYQAGRLMAANLVLVNPECFDGTDRANAQSLKDRLSADQQNEEMDELRRSVCAASGEPWWQCGS